MLKYLYLLMPVTEGQILPLGVRVTTRQPAPHLLCTHFLGLPYGPHFPGFVKPLSDILVRAV